MPRYLRWLERWPTIEALAAAETADVLREWQGLGYNRRALNLQRAARAVAARRLAGRPCEPARRRRVHGCGRSATSRSATTCFRVDTNVRRVEERTGHTFAARNAHALMDLGATVCLARVPRCGVCPLAERLSVARSPLRAAPQAVAVRGLVPAAARRTRCARSSPEGRRTTRRRSPRSRATVSCASRVRASRCPRDALRPADRASCARAARPSGRRRRSSRRISRRYASTPTASRTPTCSR